MKSLRLLMVLSVVWLSLAADASARVFTDKKGKQVNADFVRMQNGMVHLKPANKYAQTTAFPFYDFCEADQQWLRMTLEKRGQSDQIPPPPPQKDESPAPQTPARQLPPRFVPPSFAPPSGPKSSPAGIGQPSTSPTIESRTAESSVVGGQSATSSPQLSTATSAPSVNFRQTTPVVPAATIPDRPRRPSSREFFCGECQRAIPAESVFHASSMMQCPLCNAKWIPQKNSVNEARITYHSQTVTFWDQYGRRMIRYGGALVALIIGVIARQSRKR